MHRLLVHIRQNLNPGGLTAAHSCRRRSWKRGPWRWAVPMGISHWVGPAKAQDFRESPSPTLHTFREAGQRGSASWSLTSFATEKVDFLSDLQNNGLRLARRIPSIDTPAAEWKHPHLFFARSCFKKKKSCLILRIQDGCWRWDRAWSGAIFRNFYNAQSIP